MDNYEVELEKNEKRNKKYVNEFQDWLKAKNLSEKTIKKHISNISFYLNDYMNYYEVTKMEDGINMAYNFLNDWFIRKCLFATKTSLQEFASSIKKFYKCMSELNYVSKDNYNILEDEIKENMDEFLMSLESFDNGTFYDFMM